MYWERRSQLFVGPLVATFLAGAVGYEASLLTASGAPVLTTLSLGSLSLGS